MSSPPLPAGPAKIRVVSDERGSALVSSLLILLLLTVLASGGFWLSQGEMAAAQGYTQSVRSLYMAEAGLARYFASGAMPTQDSMVWEYFPDPCMDTIAYPTMLDRNLCYDDGDSEEEELLEEFGLNAPPSAAYAFTNAAVYLTSQFILSDGISPTYEVTAEARVQDAGNPALVTARVVDTYAQLAPPFEITSVFASTGGVNFGGDADDHYHFDSKAKAGKTGSCGSELVLPHIQIPGGGLFDLPLPSSECPEGKGCPYKWHIKGTGAAVDSSQATGSGIVNQMGLDWSDFLNDSFYSGLTDVQSFDVSQDFEDAFDPSLDKAFKSASSWPITRFTGDLVTDERVKGYGLLVVDGNVLVSVDKLEWTGLVLIGGTITVAEGAHHHVKGAEVVGLSCTDAERAAGLCTSTLTGDHVDMKYRPCEISQAWSQFMQLRPMDDLWREASPIF